MPNIHHSGSADDATPAPQQPQELSDLATQATHAPQDAAVPTTASAATTASNDAGPASDASDATVAALANDLHYTLTVGQARDLFAAHNRKVPAERTVQNYCIEGGIAAQKIRTTYGSEWLINEGSLLAFIEEQPIVVAAPQQPQAVNEPAPNAAQAPQELSDLATQATHAPQDAAVPTTASAATTARGGATHAAPAVPPAPAHSPIGETRTLAAVLIENAKLLATVEGKDQVIRVKDETIAELKDDRAFLRDEVREGREQRKDVKDIASRMLETMENIAIAGKLPPAAAQHDIVTARVINPDDQTSPHA